MQLFKFTLVLLIGSFSQVALCDLKDNDGQAKLDYMQNCQGCHLAQGQGLPGSVPPMKDQLGKFLAVEGGRDFLVQVPGSANAPLSNTKLADLLNWILTTMSAGQIDQSFTPYSELEVKQLRSKVLVDVAKTRADLVAQFERRGAL